MHLVTVNMRGATGATKSVRQKKRARQRGRSDSCLCSLRNDEQRPLFAGQKDDVAHGSPACGFF